MFSDPLIKTAIKAREAINTNNYFEYFKILKEVPYIMKCLMHVLSFDVRKNLIRIIKDTNNDKFTPIDEIERKLYFNSPEEAMKFAQIFTLVEGNMVKKGAPFKDVQDIVLYKMPKIIGDVNPGRELQSMVYGTKFDPLAVPTPVDHKRHVLSSQLLPPQTIATVVQQSQLQALQQREMDELRNKEEQKRKERELEQERLRLEKELKEKKMKEEEEIRRKKEEEEERERKRKKEEEEELRQKRLREEEEERLKREAEERKRREQEQKIKKQKEKEEMERKREESISNEINMLRELDFSKILDRAKERDFAKWKIAVIFQNRVQTNDYVRRFLDKKLTLSSQTTQNIEFSKVYGTESVNEKSLYCAQTVILYGDSWDEKLTDYVSRLTYINAEVIQIHSGPIGVSKNFNRKLVPHKVLSTPMPHTIDSKVTEDLESVISESLLRSCSSITKMGLEKISLCKYIKLRYENLMSVKLSTKYIQFWNNPEFFRERTNAFVTLLEKDVIRERIHKMNLLGFSESSFDRKISDTLSKLRMPEIKWNNLLRDSSLTLNNSFIEEATDLFGTFVTKLNITGFEICKENFKRLLCYVASNGSSLRSPIQNLAYGIHWNGIFNELVMKVMDEVIKPKDFEIIVDKTEDEDRYKLIDKQYEDRIKTFLSANHTDKKGFKTERKNEEEEKDTKDENVGLQPPAHKRRRKTGPQFKVKAEFKPSEIIKSAVLTEKKQWESDFEKILLDT